MPELTFRQGIVIGMLAFDQAQKESRDFPNEISLEEATGRGAIFLDALPRALAGKQIPEFPDGIPDGAFEPTDEIVGMLTLQGLI